MSRTLLSPAKRSIHTHNPTYKQNFMKEPKGEQALRRMYETLQRQFPDMGFATQIRIPLGDGGIAIVDGLINSTEVIECDGPWKKQAQLDNAARRDSELAKLGFRVWRFKEQEILERPEAVRQILTSIHMLTRKEAV